MLARISRSLQINGSRPLFLEFHLQYSSTAAAIPQKGFVVSEEYLMNSLGFSKQESVSISSKLLRLKPIKKDPDLVVNFLGNLGLNRKTHIKSIVSSIPSILFCNVEKTLKPKLDFLREIGLSGPELVSFVMGYKFILRTGLDSHIKPRVNYFRQLLGSDDKLVTALKKCPALLVHHATRTVEENVLILKKIGFSNDYVSKFIVRNPRQILVKKEGWLLDIADSAENDWGFRRGSTTFFYGVEMLSKHRKSTMDAKFDVFRSFGWSDFDIHRMFRTFPFIVGASEAKLRKRLNFYMNELGYTPQYLATHHSLFSVNFDRRVKLRYDVLKVLNEKKLNKKKRSLFYVVRLPESKFVNAYLLPHKEEIPDIFRLYMEGVSLKIEN